MNLLYAGTFSDNCSSLWSVYTFPFEGQCVPHHCHVLHFPLCSISFAEAAQGHCRVPKIKFLVNVTWKYRMWTIKQYIVSILILISNSCLQWSFLVPFQFFIVYMSMNTLELRIFCFNVGSQERKDMGGRALKYLIEFRGTNLWNFLNFVSSHLFSLICNSGAATWLAVFNLINKGGSLITSYMQLTVKVFWG